MQKIEAILKINAGLTKRRKALNCAARTKAKNEMALELSYVLGKPEAEAIKELEANGFTVLVVFRDNFHPVPMPTVEQVVANRVLLEVKRGLVTKANLG